MGRKVTDEELAMHGIYEHSFSRGTATPVRKPKPGVSSWFMGTTLVGFMTLSFLGAPPAEAAQKTVPCKVTTSGPWESKNHIEGSVILDCAQGSASYVDLSARVVEMQRTILLVNGKKVDSWNIKKSVGPWTLQNQAMTTLDFALAEPRGLCSGTNPKGNWYALLVEGEAGPGPGTRYKRFETRTISDVVLINCKDKKFSRTPPKPKYDPTNRFNV